MISCLERDVIPLRLVFLIVDGYDHLRYLRQVFFGYIVRLDLRYGSVCSCLGCNIFRIRFSRLPCHFHPRELISGFCIDHRSSVELDCISFQRRQSCNFNIRQLVFGYCHHFSGSMRSGYIFNGVAGLVTVRYFVVIIIAVILCRIRCILCRCSCNGIIPADKYVVFVCFYRRCRYRAVLQQVINDLFCSFRVLCIRKASVISCLERDLNSFSQRYGNLNNTVIRIICVCRIREFIIRYGYRRFSRHYIRYNISIFRNDLKFRFFSLIYIEFIFRINRVDTRCNGSITANKFGSYLYWFLLVMQIKCLPFLISNCQF